MYAKMLSVAKLVIADRRRDRIFLGYDIEYITGQGYVDEPLPLTDNRHGARLQDNHPEW